MSFELNKRHYFVSIFLLLFLALPLRASAVTIDTDYFGVGGIPVFFDKNGDSDFDDSGESFSSGAGMFQVDYNNYDTWGFCIDLYNAVGYGANDIDGTIEITGNYIYVIWLIDTYGDDLFASANSEENISHDAANAAALALAIWEVLYDSSWDYGDSYDRTFDSNTGTGTFSYNRYIVETANGGYYSDINDMYDKYIDSLIAAVTNTTSWDAWKPEGEYIVLRLSQDSGNTNTQDIIVNVVPEPTTALLFGFGLLGLCAVGRKRN